MQKVTPKISVLVPSIRPQYLKITQDALERQTFRDFELLTEIGLPSRGFTLSEDYNKMLRRAKGEIVVSLQDCIDIPDDFLQKVSEMDFDRKAYTFPVGKKLKRLDGVEGVAWDWRAHGCREIGDQEWEIDLAAAPRRMFEDVGGFDESYCAGWSYDNVEIGIRAKKAGYRFFCDSNNRGLAIDHDKETPHPFRETRESNAFRVSITRDMAEQGFWKLDNL